MELVKKLKSKYIKIGKFRHSYAVRFGVNRNLDVSIISCDFKLSVCIKDLKCKGLR